MIYIPRSKCALGLPIGYGSFVPNGLTWVIWRGEYTGSDSTGAPNNTIVATNQNPNGWDVDTINAPYIVAHVPANAPLGRYFYSNRDPYGTHNKESVRSFEVVSSCNYTLALEANTPLNLQNSVNYNSSGGVTLDVFARALAFLGESTNPCGCIPATVTINWGEGPLETRQVQIPQGGILSFISPTLSHTYSTNGIRTVTIHIETTDGCAKSATFSIPVSPRFLRYFCENNQCVERAVSDGSGYAFLSECANNCGTTPPVDPPTQNGPYVCLSSSYNTRRCTALIPADYQGTQYATLADCEAACGGTSNLVTRYSCTPNGCISFQTSNPNEGFSSCAEANCGDVSYFLRYFCGENGGPCRSILTNNPNAGFATAEACQQFCGPAFCACNISIFPEDARDQNLVILRVYGVTDWDLTVTAKCNGVTQTFILRENQPQYIVFHFARVLGDWTFEVAAARPDCDPCGDSDTLTVSNTTTNCPFIPQNIYLVSDPSAGLIRGEAETYFGWNLTVFYDRNGQIQTAPIATFDDPNVVWRWSVPLLSGEHHFVLEWTKPGCPTHMTEDTISVDGTQSDGCTYTKNPIIDILELHNYLIRIPAQTGLNPYIPTLKMVQTGSTTPVTIPLSPPSFFNDAYNPADVAMWSAVLTPNSGPCTYTLTWTKAGCPTHVQTLSAEIAPIWCYQGGLLYSQIPPAGATGPYTTPAQAPCHGTTTDPGTGDGGTGNCPPCPPPPDDIGTCKPTVTFVTPDANAALHNIARIRVTVADPNEQTDPCHHNFPRPCNHEPDGPALQLYLSDALQPVTWKRVSGTPLNGTWETFLDTRDISNGAHALRVSARGVGCCRKEATRAVSLNNTLQSNIFYRDTRREVKVGLVVPDAIIGIETRALEENTSRRYWMETAVRSGTDLDATPDKPYNHDDWPKHQPVLLTSGEHWDASGKRVERTNYSAHVTFRLPLSNAVRVRRKWTPQFYLNAFDLNAERIAKIRQIEEGRHYVFTNNPARLWIYENDEVTLYADFATPPVADSGQLGTNDHETDFDFIDHAGANVYAPNATDATLLKTDPTGAKVYVIVPPATPTERGEVFAFDPDSGQLALEYGVRRENRVPRFIETVKKRVICLYTHDETAHLPTGTQRTRAYDLTFSTPKRLWQLPAPATLTSVDGDTLLIACGPKLYSTDGETAPALLNTFPSPVTSASLTFVGLQNGQLWKKTSAGYVQVYTRPFPIAGVTSWSAGTAIKAAPGAGEPQTDPPRGVCAGEGVWLYGERKDGTWFDERDLRVPSDLVAKSKSVARITALDHYSQKVDPPTEPNSLTPSTSTSTDATTSPQRDERLLIGTAPNALLFVYQRSLLSEENGALPVSHDTIPRLFPFPRQKED